MNMGGKDDISFMGKVIAYSLGVKLETSVFKAKKFAIALLAKYKQFLYQTLDNSNERFLEIISYWISKEQPDQSMLVKTLNDILKKRELDNFCIAYEEDGDSIKISMGNEEIFVGRNFKDLKDERILSIENREKIYELMEKKCLREARYIGHFLLPYQKVSDICYSYSKAEDKWHNILKEIDETCSPSWACLKKMLTFIGNKGIVEEIEEDCLFVESQTNPQVNSTSVCYPMQNSPHGLCVIINNSFKGTGKERNGTMKDEEKLKETFEYLDFTVEIHQDKTAEEMEEIFKSCASYNHVNYDCFVCFILSHGCEGHVFGNDNKKIKITEIRDMFDGKNCDSLVGKPKLFFIQACQGEKVNTKNDFTLSSDGPPNGNNTSNSNASLPNICDFLIFMSSISGTTSWREVEKGSWFIQTLCEILLKNSSQSLNDKIPEINNKLSQMEGFVDRQRVKQMSDVIGNSLRFPIFLKPKII